MHHCRPSSRKVSKLGTASVVEKKKKKRKFVTEWRAISELRWWSGWEREGCERDCGYVSDVARLTGNMTTRHSKHVEKQQPTREEEEPFNTTSYIYTTAKLAKMRKRTHKILERVNRLWGAHQEKKEKQSEGKCPSRVAAPSRFSWVDPVLSLQPVISGSRLAFA